MLEQLQSTGFLDFPFGHISVVQMTVDWLASQLQSRGLRPLPFGHRSLVQGQPQLTGSRRLPPGQSELGHLPVSQLQSTGFLDFPFGHISVVQITVDSPTSQLQSRGLRPLPFGQRSLVHGQPQLTGSRRIPPGQSELGHLPVLQLQSRGLRDFPFGHISVVQMTVDCSASQLQSRGLRPLPFGHRSLVQGQPQLTGSRRLPPGQSELGHLLGVGVTHIHNVEFHYDPFGQ